MRARWKRRSTKTWCSPAQVCNFAGDRRVDSVRAGDIAEPGYRNEFHAGLQQAFGKYFVVSGEYIWKYTHNAYDFSVLGNTPIYFPIEWHNSKIPGICSAGQRAEFPRFERARGDVERGGAILSAASRWTGRDRAGRAAFRSASTMTKKFNQTTHLQYQPWKSGPWLGFNWRYDSGLVAGSVPSTGRRNERLPDFDKLNGQPAIDLSGLTADQEIPGRPVLRSGVSGPRPRRCRHRAWHRSSDRHWFQIPAPERRTTTRIRRGSLRAISSTSRSAMTTSSTATIQVERAGYGDQHDQQIALYNFLSTFSGTHYVTSASGNRGTGVPLLGEGLSGVWGSGSW